MKQHSFVTLFAFFIICTAQLITAQTQKGNWFAEGNLGNIIISGDRTEADYPNTKNKFESKNLLLSLYPRIGYFINDNFAVGTTLSFAGQMSKSTEYWDNGTKALDGKTSSASLGLSPFARYYFTKNTKNRFYAQLGAGLNFDLFRNIESNTFYDTGQPSGNYKNSLKGQNVSGELLIGFNHFFTGNVAFNSAIGYSYSKKMQTTTSNSTYSGTTYPTQLSTLTAVSGGLVWNFGFMIMFPKKKVE